MAMATAMAATMAVGTAISASATDYDLPADNVSIVSLMEESVNYNNAGFYSVSSGNEAPFGMSTACIGEVTTDSDGNVTIALKEGTVSVMLWRDKSVTVIGCVNTDTGADYYVENEMYPNGAIVIPAEDIAADSSYGSVGVTVTFGGELASIIDKVSAISPMSNPMSLELRVWHGDKSN